jgi:(4-alkanoyl-5-oxo-2,5-dihydrofuran-3-yl)methyl phosphate reductase
MILVTGATGNIGAELVKQLAATAKPLRVVTRNETKVSHLDPRIERVIGDLHDPSVVRKAVQGVERIFLLPFLFDSDHAPERLLLEEAKKAGVKHVVMISSGAVRLDVKGIARLHREKEQLVQDSGIPWTFLRPGAFMSNVLQWIPTIKSQSKVFNPTADGKSAPISPSDIASVAALAMTANGHEGQAYEVTGAQLLSVHDQVRILSNVLNRPIQCVDIPIEAGLENLRAAGVPQLIVDSLAIIWARLREGKGTFQTDQFQKLTGKSPQTFETWCQEYQFAFAS